MLPGGGRGAWICSFQAIAGVLVKPPETDGLSCYLVHCDGLTSPLHPGFLQSRPRDVVVLP